MFLLCTLLLTGCAQREVKQGEADRAGGAETEQIVQKEDETEKKGAMEGEPAEEELQPFPEEELHNIFDIAYSTYAALGLEEEESIRYEVKDAIKMIAWYEGGTYILPPDKDVKAQYRSWRSQSPAQPEPETPPQQPQ